MPCGQQTVSVAVPAISRHTHSATSGAEKPADCAPVPAGRDWSWSGSRPRVPGMPGSSRAGPGRPGQRQWVPRLPDHTRSPVNGWSITPRTGLPPSIRPINVPQSGLPMMKALVPSIGSIDPIEATGARAGLEFFPDDAVLQVQPWPDGGGWQRSAARSAFVTGSKPCSLPLSSIDSFRRKWGSTALPERSARACAKCQMALVARRFWRRHGNSPGAKGRHASSIPAMAARIVWQPLELANSCPSGNNSTDYRLTSRLVGLLMRANIPIPRSVADLAPLIEAAAHFGRFLPRLGPTTLIGLFSLKICAWNGT